MDTARLLPLVMVLLLMSGGCVPTVQSAELPSLASQTWSGQSESPTSANARLAELLNVPELGRLTSQALANNSDIRIGSARVEQSRALLRAARLAVLPAISLAAGSSTRTARTGRNPLDFTNAFAGLDVAIDPDLFGRLKAGKRAAVSRVRAAELQQDAIALAVEADVALAYVQRAAIAKRIAILEINIARAVDLDRVIRVRSAEGAATRVDQGLQSIRLLSLREEGSRLSQALDQTRTALAILTGSEAPQFSVAAANLDAIAIPRLEPLPPADVLSARPDVRAAEASMQAAQGDVALARAAFFPRIGITIQALFETATGGPLGTSLNLGSSLLAPIFSRGRLTSELQFVSAVQLEAVERYRQTILAALAEVEDARIAGGRSFERAKLLDTIVDEARLTARLANVQYIEGEEDLQNVLDAETSLSRAEDAQAVGRLERLFAGIALYRSMGGYHK